MQMTAEEITIKGSPICRGIALGKPFFLSNKEIPIEEVSIPIAQVHLEVERYQLALKRSLNELKNIQRQLELESSAEGVLILESQLEMLRDPLLTDEIEKNILSEHKNAEFILHQTLLQIKKKFTSLTNRFFIERYKDFQDLINRILCQLQEEECNQFHQFPPHSIICAMELTSTDIAGVSPSFIGAFITENGGATSHAAIIAKSKGIPFITNIDFNLLKENADSQFIVDSRIGKVILNPKEKTLQAYEKLKKNMMLQIHDFQEKVKWPAETFDGFPVRLYANLEMPHELDLVHQFGGEGVGLFRSEYIFFPKNRIPNEEEQFQIYSQVVQKMQGLPIVIRTFDLGGDKTFLCDSLPEEKNSFGGRRATQFLLKEKTLFKAQLRAILRASIYGKVSVLFPMISTLSELKEAKHILQEAYEELNITDRVRLGCMIEVPSAALNIDHFVKECDFLSIGTNDLVQYSLATDRRDHPISDFYEHVDPSIIRLFQFIITEANKAQIPVAVCGEMASDPRFVPLLLGLGIQELSVTPRFLPIVKNAIRSTSIVEAVQLAERVLKMTTAKEVMQLLIEEYWKNVPHDLFYNVQQP